MYRKDSIIIEEWLKSSNKALLVTGARQIGKTWHIREEIAQSGSCGRGVCTSCHESYEGSSRQMA